MRLPKVLLEGILRKINGFKFYREYRKKRLKLLNMQLRIKFLEKCSRNNIIPRFLSFRVPNNGCFHQATVENFQRRLLKNELRTAKKSLEEHEINVATKRQALQMNTPEVLLESIAFYCHEEVELERIVVNERHKNKLIQL